MAAQSMSIGEPHPGALRSRDAGSVAATLVDRQRATLAARFPDMVGALGMRPVELWFVWGALAELLGDDAGRIQEEFAAYMRRRHGLGVGPAEEIAAAVRQACTASNALVDGMALGGRQAARGGPDTGCFLAAALYLRYCHGGD